MDVTLQLARYELLQKGIQLIGTRAIDYRIEFRAFQNQETGAANHEVYDSITTTDIAKAPVHRQTSATGPRNLRTDQHVLADGFCRSDFRFVSQPFAKLVHVQFGQVFWQQTPECRSLFAVEFFRVLAEEKGLPNGEGKSLTDRRFQSRKPLFTRQTFVRQCSVRLFYKDIGGSHCGPLSTRRTVRRAWSTRYGHNAENESKTGGNCARGKSSPPCLKELRCHLLIFLYACIGSFKTRSR